MKLTYKDNYHEITIDEEAINFLDWDSFHKEIPKIIQTIVNGLYPKEVTICPKEK